MRARNIKPGFFANPDLGECSFGARLLFIGLWCLADREGRLLNRPSHIKGELFRYDSVDLQPWLEELSTKGFIDCYQSDNLSVIHIVNFAAHQRPHFNEKPSILPEKGKLATKVESSSNQGDNRFALNDERGMRKEESGRMDETSAASCPYDLDNLLLEQWGREGRQSYAVKVKMIGLGRVHGFDRLKFAIEEAAKFNKRSCAYVEGILEKRGKKPAPSGSNHPYYYDGIHKPKAGAA